MPKRGLTIACFDLDGVLVDSEAFKLAAWDQAVLEVLDLPRETLAALSPFNKSHRGVPRRLKFQHAVDVAGASSSSLALLLDSYAALLVRRRPEVIAVPGAVALLRGWAGPSAVVTSAPRHEAVGLLDRLGFPRFDFVFDAGVAKTVALSRLSRSFVRVVFFGDAMADRSAAYTARVDFVAVGAALPYASRDAGRALDLRGTRALLG